MSQQCKNCFILNQIIEAQQREIDTFKRIIAGATDEAITIVSEADKELTKHLPRGRWAYLKASREVAITLLKRLGV